MNNNEEKNTNEENLNQEEEFDGGFEDDDLRDEEKSPYYFFFSIEEQLGPNWQEYFTTPECMQGISAAISFHKYSRELSEIISALKGKEYDHSLQPTIEHEFVSMVSATKVNEERLSIKAVFKSLGTGTEEMWIIDVAKEAPTWEQILDIFYGEGQDCAVKILIYTKILYGDRDPERHIENRALEYFVHFVLECSEDLYQLFMVRDPDSVPDIIFISSNPFVDRRRKIPNRLEMEKLIWDYYFDSYLHTFKYYESSLITDRDLYKSKTPFFVTPTWTEKGLIMRIHGKQGSQENAWFMQNCKEEIMKLYPDCKVKIHVKSKIPCIMGIRLDRVPVWDFVEASSDYKLKYAEDIRNRQMLLIHQVEDIFRNYKPDEPVN